MNAARAIFHLARADFLERVRRYSFLIMLGLVVFLGYQAALGNINVQVGSYRGEYNSAWVGSSMAIIASFFLGWFGFYLVKGSVGRDRETGVGQIMASTPLTRPLYTIGKWLSNYAVLLVMVVVLAIVALAIQIFAGESDQLDLIALISPFIIIALPMLALTAALAVLFECIGFLGGGLGNIVYLFLFSFTLPLSNTLSKATPALEPLGFNLLQESMGAAAQAAYPDYSGGFVLGSTDIPITGVFPWSGVEWTAGIVFVRLSFVGIALLLVLIASVFFDRFDSARVKPRRGRSSPPSPEPAVLAPSSATSTLTFNRLEGQPTGSAFPRVILLELKLLLKRQPWWWFAVAGGVVFASLAMSAGDVRAYILPVAWLWPILVWSGLGNRERRHNTYQMVFSSAAPLRGQLLAAWLAGFIVCVLTGGGVTVKLLSVGDGSGLLAWLSAALFIPSLALACGVWSSSPKLFEVVYVVLWYLGPMNQVLALDYLGANSPGNLRLFAPLSLTLIVLAFLGRARQLRS